MANSCLEYNNNNHSNNNNNNFTLIAPHARVEIAYSRGWSRGGGRDCKVADLYTSVYSTEVCHLFSVSFPTQAPPHPFIPLIFKHFLCGWLAESFKDNGNPPAPNPRAHTLRIPRERINKEKLKSHRVRLDII